MQIKLNTIPEDLDLIKEQLYQGACIDLAKATGYSLKLVYDVLDGRRRNNIIVGAARELIELHRNNMKTISISYKRPVKSAKP